jgi:hypothetical protein
MQFTINENMVTLYLASAVVLLRVAFFQIVNIPVVRKNSFQMNFSATFSDSIQNRALFFPITWVYHYKPTLLFLDME